MKSNRMAAAAVAAIAVVLFAATFWFEEMPEGITRGFGAERFPRLVLGTILALAVFLFIKSPPAEPPGRIPGMVWISGASLIAYMALIPVVGMLPAMAIYLAAVGWLWGERRAWVLGASAFLVTASIWGVFVKGFGIQLPRGLL